MTLISTISTDVTHTVTLNNGTYAPDLSITNTGSVVIPGNPVDSSGIHATSVATVTNAGLLSDYGNTIYMGDGGAVTNSGTIDATRFDGVDVESGVATVINTGTINATGTRFSYGVFLGDGGAITDSGTIAGATGAIEIGNGSFTLTVLPGAVLTGAVYDKGSNYGIAGDLVLGGTNAGSLDIGAFAGFGSISFASGADWTLAGTSAQLTGGQTISGVALGDEVVLQGEVASSGSYVVGYGLELSNGEALTINTVAGTAFYVTNDGSNTTIQALINTISTDVTQTVTLNNGTYAPNITITNTGSVIVPGMPSDSSGLYAAAAATVTNAGVITDFGSAISFEDGGVVTNSGTINATRFDGVAVNAGVGTVTNTGTINATGSVFSYGVFLADGGTVTDSGTIAGTDGAVLVRSGSLTLDVLPGAVFTGAVNDEPSGGDLILGGTTASSLNVDMFSGFTSIAFAPGADWTLTGDAAQLASQQTISGVTLGDELVLQGEVASSGSFVTGTGLVLNNGETLNVNAPGPHQAFYVTTNGTNTTIQELITTISTDVTQTVTLNNGTYAPNISITNTGSVIVPGMPGYSSGISASSAATVTNAGVVSDYGSAISLQVGGVVINSGTLDATRFDGVAATSGAATVTNTGKINATGNQFSYGVLLGDGGTVTNSGTIAGNAGAVDVTNGSFTLDVLPGAVFSGSVNDHASTGDLILGGTTASSLNIDTFSGFSSIGFAPGAHWTLTGDPSQLSSGQTISGFTLGDEMVVQGEVASSGSYVNGTGLVLSNGETLHVNAPAANDVFYVTNNGTNTTIGERIATIASSVSHDVTLGNGTYTPNISVTTAGKVAGNAYGVYARNAATVTNSGTVSGDIGVELDNGGVIVNSGAHSLIQGFEGYGLDLFGPSTVINAGTITGMGDGVYLEDGGAVTNSGTISGITNTSGAFTLTADPGAGFGNSVVDGANTGDLVLGGTTAGTLNISTFSGFPSISFATGSNWTLSGTDAQLSTGETIAGFSPGDEIMLAGSPATAGTFITGVGLVLNNGQTLNVNSPPANAAFYITSNSYGTNIQELVATIASPVGHSVDLGNGTYTPNISVTSAGTVTGNYYGIGSGAAATVTNSGTVSGAYGVVLNDGGVVINSGTQSLIQGTYGAGVFLYAPASVFNAGTITGTTEGVYLYDGGAVTNSGTISGIYNHAGAFTLTADPGAGFGNSVVDAANTGVLVLGGTTGGTLNISTFSGFPSVSFAPGAEWTLGGLEADFSTASVAGFTDADTIDLTDLAPASIASYSFDSATGVLAISMTNGAPLDITFAGSNGPFQLHPDGTGGIDVTIPCFSSGTRILTPAGDKLVEDLAVGDSVVTVRDGGPATSKVVWTGRRTIDIVRHVTPEIVRPVRILAGAFGNGIPERDLRLSPHHAVYIDGELFEAIALVNDITIIQEINTRYVTYHHIELEAHDIMLAEGLPAESFLDTGNRDMFENSEGPIQLHADFRTADNAPTCAPLHRTGPTVDRVHAQLLAIATSFVAARQQGAA